MSSYMAQGSSDTFVVNMELLVEILIRSNHTKFKLPPSYRHLSFFTIRFPFDSIRASSTDGSRSSHYTEYFSLITCHRNALLSFEAYRSPFNDEVWFCTFLAILLLSVPLHTYSRYKKYARNHKSREPSCLVILYTSILNQSATVGASTNKKLEFRLIFSCWLLACLVITNCYNSLIIRELNAPLPGPPINFTEDVFCENRVHDIAAKYYTRHFLSNDSNSTKSTHNE